MEVLARLAELERRLANLLLLGSVRTVDVTHARVQVQSGQLLTTKLPWLTTRAGHDSSYWAPEVGEQVLVLCPQGEVALGVVLPALYQTAHAAPSQDSDECLLNFRDGASFSYHRGQHNLDITLPANGTVSLNALGGITFTGDLTVVGNLHATANVRDARRAMQEDRRIYDQHTHISYESGTPTSTPSVQQ